MRKYKLLIVFIMIAIGIILPFYIPTSKAMADSETPQH